MKLWTRLMVGGLALVLALSLCAGPADAASKKSKKKEAAKKAQKREERRERSRGAKRYLSGTNTSGRAGLFYADTSDVASVGQWEGSVHALFGLYTGSTLINFPIGGHFGVAKNLDLSANANLGIFSVSGITIGGTTYGGGSSTQFILTLGGKYRIAGSNNEAPDFSVGADLVIPTYTGGQLVFMPKGTISYVLESGMLLNGEIAIGISSVTYVMADAGIGIPFSPGLTGIAEIGANQMGYLGSLLAAGIRAGDQDLKFNALIGIPFNGGGGFVIGGGLILASK